ncbi:sporulation integral membrane protein YlbJ [Paenibacillus sp. 7124]|uniref:Sporulation integral membrane protein YlbJ n=1 Tax=Paenibacillus apii TaxID=1850370 RepID=A0A6M1PMN2_9BACL|nr:sporulation integral membrane protein YlbJ [Paenibacillus apii]NGM84749.1 sporulation integral membrane protein YlbJ [Paenibacillus apii]NJJ41367.1 sporulation integral membrane protein YlbJ [Paenibacillus apii]
MTLNKLKGPFLALVLAGCMLLLLLHPEAALSAALRGLAIWWDVLFPSLFPFFVISELMLGFGVVHLFGALLDPLMRPLFRIPGSGGFVMAMGYVSGYPVGARLTAKLREQNLLTRVEGERLVAFTTSSDPIFLLGAVSVGFFQNAALGPCLAIAHYGSGLLVGLLMSFHGRKEEADAAATPRSVAERTASRSATPPPSKAGGIRAALASMAEARRRDGRSFGELLKEAVQSSLHLIIVVGGLVVFFTVLMELLNRAGVMSFLISLTGGLLSLFRFPAGLNEAITSGFFEVTLGAKASGTAAAALPFKAAAAAFILSWGGLSVHAQVASIWNGTGLRYLPFMTARFLHAFLAAGFTLLLWRPMMEASPALAFPWTPVPGLYPPAAGFALLPLLLAGTLLLSLATAATGRVLRLLRPRGSRPRS